MGIFPTQREVNDNRARILGVSVAHQAPLGHYEELLALASSGVGPTTSGAYSASQAIQCALMIPFYMQESFQPVAVDWICVAAKAMDANTTAMAYNWIITDENGKVVATTPIVNNTACTVGLMTQTFTLATSPLRPGTYYYGFAYYDNTTTVSSTTTFSQYSIGTAAKQKIMGIKMWTYFGTGAQVPSTMTNGASCTLSIPTTNIQYNMINCNIRCIM